MRPVLASLPALASGATTVDESSFSPSTSTTGSKTTTNELQLLDQAVEVPNLPLHELSGSPKAPEPVDLKVWPIVVSALPISHSELLALPKSQPNSLFLPVLPPKSSPKSPALPETPTKEPNMSSTTGSTTPKASTSAPVDEYTETGRVKPSSDYTLQLYHSSQHVPDDFLPSRVTEHTYFCYQGLKINEFVIGIPEPYYDDAARGHAVYVTGVAPGFSLDQFEKIFRKYGTVKGSVALIDMVSEQTFRWVIMSSFAEAQQVLKFLQRAMFGSWEINVCCALAPGTIIHLGDLDVAFFHAEQHHAMCYDGVHYGYAMIEFKEGKRRPPIYQTWFNNLISTYVADRFEGSTAESPFLATMQHLNLAPKLEFWSPMQVNIFKKGEHYEVVSTDKGKAREMTEESTAPFEETDEGSKASNAVAQAVPLVPELAVPIVAVTPAIAPLPAAPIVPVVAISSWANIAAPTASTGASSTNASRHLMFELHPENKPSSSAPRVAAPVNPNVVAHAQGEPIEEQMRVVFIFNLPSTITLKDVSDAVTEGPVLNIKFAADSDNGNRYAGIVFQYARDAYAFHQALLQERAYSTPGRFRFIVDAGRDTPYPYDEELEMMAEPMYASRRLTIVKKGFFFQFSKRQLRQLCEKLVTAEKIQLIWLYNGGNGTVVFSDVKSAVVVKTELDRMAAGKGKGNMTAVFADLHTTFSKDPCAADLRLITDIKELNDD